MNTRIVGPKECTEIIEFIKQFPHELDALGIDKQRFLEAYLSKFEVHKAPKGVVLFQNLEFDSKFFGTSSAKLELFGSFPLESLPEVGFLQAKVHADMRDEAQALEEFGFMLASKDITYAMEAQAHSMKLDFCTEKDVPKLMAISKVAYAYSRFHQDPHIPDENASELEATWIKNCFFEKLTDEIIVVREAGVAAGYVACKLLDDLFGANKVGRIILIAVDPNHQGKGLGKQLVNASHQWFKMKGCTHVVVGTQMQNSATAFYEKCGFKEIAQMRSYHKWKTLNKK